MRNLVAKHMTKKGGPFNPKDHEGRAFKNKKIKKELDELDEHWIDEEIEEYESDRKDS